MHRSIVPLILTRGMKVEFSQLSLSMQQTGQVCSPARSDFSDQNNKHTFVRTNHPPAQHLIHNLLHIILFLLIQQIPRMKVTEALVETKIKRPVDTNQTTFAPNAIPIFFPIKHTCNILKLTRFFVKVFYYIHNRQPQNSNTENVTSCANHSSPCCYCLFLSLDLNRDIKSGSASPVQAKSKSRRANIKPYGTVYDRKKHVLTLAQLLSPRQVNVRLAALGTSLQISCQHYPLSLQVGFSCRC